MMVTTGAGERAMDAVWREHGRWLGTTSRGEAAERMTASRVPVLCADPNMRGDEIVRGVVRACLEPVLAGAGAVADGCHEADDIHRLRVAIRRLRTAWRELGALIDGTNAGPEFALTAAFRDLAPHPHREPALKAIREQLKASGGPDVDGYPLGQEDGRDPVQIVRDPAFQDCLLQLIEFTLTPQHSADPVSVKGIRKQVRRRLQTLLDQVVRNHERFELLDEAQQQRVRQRLKRLRDLAQIVSPLYESHAVDRFLDALKPAHQALEAHHDSLMALALYERIAREHDLQAWYAVGWLRGRTHEALRQCRRALRDAAKADPFW